MKKLILIAVAAGALAACQTTMPVYQAAGGVNSTGYLSTSVGSDRYAVVYTGDDGMSRAQVAEYALLRAAELTKEMGQEWFAVLDSSTSRVELASGDPDLASKGALDQGSTSTGSGGPAPAAGGPGVGSPSVATGPSTGGFGGGDVPYQVLERWTPPKGYQTTITIQMGSGDEASFPGVSTQPEIYDATSVSAEIRAKMAQ